MRIFDCAHSLVEEAFGARCIALRREQEINGLPRRVHCSIQISAPALNLYICLVNTVALVRTFEMRPATLAQLRRIGLNPRPDTTGVHFDASLCEEFGNMLVG
jgi:hypothetical protein